MDLSFSPLGRDRRRIVAMPDLAMMLACVAARQAASPTARAHSSLGIELPAMMTSFNATVASLLAERPPG